MEPSKNYGQKVLVSEKLPLELPKRKKKWSVMSQSRSPKSPNEVSNQLEQNIYGIH